MRHSATLPFRRRILFFVVLIVLLWLLTEVMAGLLISAQGRSWSWMGEYQAQRAKAAAGSTAMTDMAIKALGAETSETLGKDLAAARIEALHPYVGFVWDPTAVKSIINAYGWPQLSGEPGPIHKRRPGQLIVGILGGSVAMQFQGEGKASFEDELKRDPRFAELQFVYTSAALAGYKQPQQLMATAYLLALGAEFDIIICIDGFNEVATDGSGNRFAGTHPIFPRDWTARVRKLPTREELKLLGLLTIENESRQAWARFWSERPYCWSPIGNLIWLRGESKKQTRIHALQVELNKSYGRAEKTFEQTGPPYAGSGAQVFEDLAIYWRDSSLQLNKLCTANGIRYYHFLQPNQYVENSKPMSEAERDIAIIEEDSYSKGARAGYPSLIQRGVELAAAGERFTDMTQLFATTSDPVYKDSCCHFNQLGMEMIGRRIAQAILADPPEIRDVNGADNMPRQRPEPTPEAGGAATY